MSKSIELKKPTFNQLELTFGQKCYIKFCNMLGVKIFKKYWPNEGSVWNNKHANKLNIHDLEYIIESANRYTSQHLISIFMEIVIIFPLFIFEEKKNNKKNCAFFSVLGIIHTYAFMVHQYNRILAKAHINYIKKYSSLNTNNTKTNCVTKYVSVNKGINYTKKFIQTAWYESYNNIFFYRIFISPGIQIGPILSEKKMILFVDYLINNYTEEYILEQYYLNSCKELYLKWKVECINKKTNRNINSHNHYVNSIE